MVRTKRQLALFGLSALACNADASATTFDSATDPSTTSSATVVDTSSSSGPSTTLTTATSADSSGSSTEGPIFDLGIQPDAPAPGDGCTAVDFLFVIDDSSSMFEHQQNLVDNFPAFIDGIESTLASVDSYQVGVIATDPFAGNPGQCILLGALITSTEGAGPESSNEVCGPYADGFNYMTDADDLDQTFACAAQVGTIGSGSERPMEAMVTAVSKDLGDPGECNEGFLRDEALLVIVVITDEYDGEGDPEPGNGREPPTSIGNPQTWYDAVVAAKNGIPQNATALVITNYEDGPCPPADLGHDGVNIVAWAELFGANGFVGGLCEPDYGPIFAQATDVIANACENFVPEG